MMWVLLDRACNLREQFGETKEGQWIARNAHRYGFIIRYPKGKEQIAGYQYEPWHLRYLGKTMRLKYNTLAKP